MLSRLEFAVGLLIWCGVLWDGFATIILPRTVDWFEATKELRTRSYAPVS